MRIHIDGEYNTFFEINDKYENVVYCGNVFNVIDIKGDEFKILLYNEQYVIKQLRADFYIAITKNNYYLIKNTDFKKIIDYSYKTIETDSISKTDPIKFLELYFQNNIDTVELHFQDETEIKNLTTLDIDDCKEQSLCMYAMCDNMELELNYNKKSELLLDHMKIL